jgi:putative sterol carrier protein
VVVGDGSTRAGAGEAPGADLTFETDWKEWIDISMHGKSPARAVLGRKLRPKGSPLALRRFSKAFSAR